MGYLNIVLDTSHIQDFSRRLSEPLGILPQFPILLGGKTISIDVMVVQGHFLFNFLLVWDYIYDMKVVVSTLFQVMHFSHNENIVIIDQLSFSYPNACTNFGHFTPSSDPSV